jgi:hypothetical protein
MPRPKKDKAYDARFEFKLPSELKKNAKIQALQKGYDSLADYLVDLLRKDGVKDE